MSGIGTPALASSGGAGGSSVITSLIGVVSTGQATMGNSLPVVLASDQSAVPVSLATLPNPSNLDIFLSTLDTDVKTNIVLQAGSNVIGHVVTDSGSVVAATLAAETTKVIGTVNQGTSPWQVQLAAETTKVIGTINMASGQTIGISSGSAVIGHVVTDSGSVVAATLAAETTKVIGTVNQGTSPWQVQLAAETTKVIGTVNVASGQTIGISTGSAVIGHVIVDSGTITAVTAITNALPSGTNVIGHVIVDSGTITAVTAITNALPAGSNVIGHVIVDSGTITAVTAITNALPTGSNVIGHVITDAGSVANSTIVVATVPAATTMQNAATASGNGTSLNVSGYSTAIISVTTAVAMSGGTTLNFEASVDDSNWVAITYLVVGQSGMGTTTTFANDYQFNVAGYKSVRARISAYSAGTITAKGYVVAGSGATQVTMLAAGANFIGNVAVTSIAGGSNVIGHVITDSGSVVDTELPAAATLGDGTTNPSVPAVGGFLQAYNGATWDRVRTPTIFKTVVASSSGNTVVWTPTTGKKFRLMRLLIDLTSNVSRTSGAVTEVTFQDATSAINIGFSTFVPTTAVATGQGGYTSGWIDLGNGILSALANNALNVNLSAALASGECRVTVAGTEE